MKIVSYRYNAMCSTLKGISLTSPFSFLLTLGPPLPKALYGFSMLDILGDAYIFGGVDSGWNQNSAIYQLSGEFVKKKTM